MNIVNLKRPWDKSSRNYGTRLNSDPWYQSLEWKRIKQHHKAGFTRAKDNTMLSNMYCIACYNEGKGEQPMRTVDHITPISQGGSKEGPLQSLCAHHDSIKCAREGNERRCKP